MAKLSRTKHFLKSKQFWIGVVQLAGGLSSGFVTGNWAWAIPQAVTGAMAIIDRVFSSNVKLHFKKKVKPKNHLKDVSSDLH